MNQVEQEIDQALLKHAKAVNLLMLREITRLRKPADESCRKRKQLDLDIRKQLLRVIDDHMVTGYYIEGMKRIQYRTPSQVLEEAFQNSREDDDESS